METDQRYILITYISTVTTRGKQKCVTLLTLRVGLASVLQLKPENT